MLVEECDFWRPEHHIQTVKLDLIGNYLAVIFQKSANFVLLLNDNQQPKLNLKS